jgi:hypothetical protein
MEKSFWAKPGGVKAGKIHRRSKQKAIDPRSRNGHRQSGRK